MNSWADFWTENQDYHSLKQQSFQVVESYLHQPPKTILDIGCGFAFESRQFAKKYHSEIWLLDGDAESNTSGKREIRFGSAESMAFYNRLSDIYAVLEQDQIENYVLLDVANYSIPADQKFDLICSWYSCGFHYPVDVYRELIQKHSHLDTKVILDLRKKNLDKLGVEILDVLEDGEKHIKAVVKL